MIANNLFSPSGWREYNKRLVLYSLYGSCKTYRVLIGILSSRKKIWDYNPVSGSSCRVEQFSCLAGLVFVKRIFFLVRKNLFSLFDALYLGSCDPNLIKIYVWIWCTTRCEAGYPQNTIQWCISLGLQLFGSQVSRVLATKYDGICYFGEHDFLGLLYKKVCQG